MSRTVLITGASTGIGRVTAELFQRNGWNVAGTMRSPERHPDLAALPNVLCPRLDVTEPASIEAALAQTIERFGAIDVVVNNAGYGLVGPFETAEPEQVRRQIDTNVIGLMNVTRAALPHFRERGDGVFVNVASFGGRLAFPLYSVYHATKWAVEGFSESLQYEVRPFGIRVKIIEPGPISTDFYDRSMDVTTTGQEATAYDAYASRILGKMTESGKRGAPPKRVAEVILKAADDRTTRLRYGVNTMGLLALRRVLPGRLFRAIVRTALEGL